MSTALSGAALIQFSATLDVVLQPQDLSGAGTITVTGSATAEPRPGERGDLGSAGARPPRGGTAAAGTFP